MTERLPDGISRQIESTLRATFQPDRLNPPNVYWISDRAIPQRLAATDWY